MIKIKYLQHLNKNQSSTAKYVSRQYSKKFVAKKKQQVMHTTSNSYVLDYHALSQHCDKIANRITKKTF